MQRQILMFARANGFEAYLDDYGNVVIVREYIGPDGIHKSYDTATSMDEARELLGY